MSRKFVGVVVVTLAVTGLTATRVSAQSPFNINGVVPDSGIAATEDPNSNDKELGPVNSNTTKIGSINTDAVPTLDFTVINAQVDLDTVWLTTKKDQSNNDQWLYFGWLRDSSNGSGFISIEFHKSGLPTGCVYVTNPAVDFKPPATAGETALVNTCNPWRGRSDGDFVILWDQQGSSIDPVDDIVKRVFSCTGAGVPYTCTLGPNVPLGVNADAQISSDGFRGELAINLTTDVFPEDSCETFANVIPGTVTGNSDTADYKDTVLASFDPITNCGILTVTKRLVNADGVTTRIDATPVFGYKVDRQAGGGAETAIRFAQDAGDHPFEEVVGTLPTDGRQYVILRPNATTNAVDKTAPGIKGGQTQVHIDLIPGTNYRIIETSTVAAYGLVNIRCFDGTGSNPAALATTLSANATAGATGLSIASTAGFAVGDYVLIGDEKLLVTASTLTSLTVERAQLGTTAAAHASGDAVTRLQGHVVATTLNAASGLFQVVVPNTIAQTDCVITNQFVLGTSSVVTVQNVILRDTANITLQNTPSATGLVDFYLYDDLSVCNADGQAGSPGVAPTGSAALATFTGKALTSLQAVTGTLPTASKAGTDGNVISASGTFYWKVRYRGDDANNPSTTTCVETTAVTITNN